MNIFFVNCFANQLDYRLPNDIITDSMVIRSGADASSLGVYDNFNADIESVNGVNHDAYLVFMVNNLVNFEDNYVRIIKKVQNNFKIILLVDPLVQEKLTQLESQYKLSKNVVIFNSNQEVFVRLLCEWILLSHRSTNIKCRNLAKKFIHSFNYGSAEIPFVQYQYLSYSEIDSIRVFLTLLMAVNSYTINPVNNIDTSHSYTTSNISNSISQLAVNLNRGQSPLVVSENS